MDQQQIDRIDPEPGEAPLGGPQQRCRFELLGRDLGGNEQFVAVDAGAADAFADRRLVAIAYCRVDVAVSGGDRLGDGVGGPLAGEPPGAEADGRNPGAIGGKGRGHQSSPAERGRAALSLAGAAPSR